MSSTDSRRDGVNRRNLLKGGAGAALLAGLGSATPAKAAGKKVVIGGFVDGALVPFKDKIIPLAQAQGFDIQFLQDEYGVTLEKFFNDAQSGAGQYDLYLARRSVGSAIRRGRGAGRPRRRGNRRD